jgi:hypothetical protein
MACLVGNLDTRGDAQGTVFSSLDLMRRQRFFGAKFIASFPTGTARGHTFVMCKEESAAMMLVDRQIAPLKPWRERESSLGQRY